MWFLALTVLSALTWAKGQEIECPFPYRVINDRCYFFDFYDTAQWDNARGICNSIDGDLLILEDPFEWAALRDYIIDFYGPCTEWPSAYAKAWIGAYPRLSDGEWVWAPNETELTFYDWLEGLEPEIQPFIAVAISCYDQLHWVGENIEKDYHLICETTPISSATTTTTPEPTTPSTTTPLPEGCPPGFDEIDGIGCYQAFDDPPRIFPDAVAACNSIGAKLAELETIAEYNAIVSYLDCSASLTYVGGLEAGECDYRWLSTGEPADYLFWYPNEPNEQGENDNALAIYCGTNGWGYNDITGKDVYSYRFLCEAPYAGGITPPPNDCQSGYSRIEGISNSCYKVVQEPVSIGEAFNNCQSEGGSLIQLETEDEWDRVKIYMRGKQGAECGRGRFYYYVGGYELGINGQYYWHTTGEPAEIWQWHTGFPSDDRGDSVLAIAAGFSSFDYEYAFVDFNPADNIEYFYICEIED